MGLPQDTEFRESHPRIDDEDHQGKVESARKIILIDGYAVENANVEQLLKDESLVPVQVSDLHGRNLSSSFS